MSIRLTLLAAVVLWAIISIVVSFAWAGGMPDKASRSVQQQGIDGIIVKLRGDIDEAKAVAAGARLSKTTGVALRYERQFLSGAVVYRLPSARSPASVDALVKRIAADPAIEYAEPDSIITIQPKN